MIQIDMEMPKNCLDCNLRYQSFCSVDGHHEPHLEKERCPLKVTPPQPRKGYLSIDDVMSVFDDFMCGEVDEDGTETFLEMLKDKAESEA